MGVGNTDWTPDNGNAKIRLFAATGRVNDRVGSGDGLRNPAGDGAVDSMNKPGTVYLGAVEAIREL